MSYDGYVQNLKIGANDEQFSTRYVRTFQDIGSHTFFLGQSYEHSKHFFTIFKNNTLFDIGFRLKPHALAPDLKNCSNFFVQTKRY
jgi:hypothetical protein